MEVQEEQTESVNTLSLCFFPKQAQSQGSTTEYDAHGWKGQYVYIRHVGRQVLTLCEVSVRNLCLYNKAPVWQDLPSSN